MGPKIENELEIEFEWLLSIQDFYKSMARLLRTGVLS